MTLTLDPREVERVADPAMKAFGRSGELWGLTAAQQRSLLGSPTESDFADWQRGEYSRVTAGV